MKIEVGKFYKTRNGRKVRIYATDGATLWSTPTPIHGAWVQMSGVSSEQGWHPASWRSDGYYMVSNPPLESPMDIIAEWREPLSRFVEIEVSLWNDGAVSLNKLTVEPCTLVEHLHVVGIRKIELQVKEGDIE